MKWFQTLPTSWCSSLARYAVVEAHIFLVFVDSSHRGVVFFRNQECFHQSVFANIKVQFSCESYRQGLRFKLVIGH